MRMESAGSGVDAVQVIVVGFDRLKRRHVLDCLLLLNEIKLYAGTLRSLEDRFAWNATGPYSVGVAVPSPCKRGALGGNCTELTPDGQFEGPHHQRACASARERARSD